MTSLASHPRVKAALGDRPWRTVVARVELTLPLPPSANGLWFNRTKKQLGIAKSVGKPLPGRGKSERYRTWERAAKNAMQAQRPGRIHGPYALVIVVNRDAPGDIDNRIKALSDLLVGMGVVADDRHADSIFISRSDAVDRHECLVTVRPALPAAERRVA